MQDPWKGRGSMYMLMVTVMTTVSTLGRCTKGQLRLKGEEAEVGAQGAWLVPELGPDL